MSEQNPKVGSMVRLNDRAWRLQPHGGPRLGVISRIVFNEWDTGDGEFHVHLQNGKTIKLRAWGFEVLA